MWQKPLGEWAERNVYKKEMGLVDSARGNTVHLMNAESLHPKNPRQQCTFTIAPQPPSPCNANKLHGNNCIKTKNEELNKCSQEPSTKNQEPSTELPATPKITSHVITAENIRRQFARQFAKQSVKPETFHPTFSGVMRALAKVRAERGVCNNQRGGYLMSSSGTFHNCQSAIWANQLTLQLKYERIFGHLPLFLNFLNCF